MIKKIIFAFYRTIVGIITLLVGMLVILYTVVVDSVKTYLLRNPKKRNTNFEEILDEEFARSQKEYITQPNSAPVTKK